MVQHSFVFLSCFWTDVRDIIMREQQQDNELQGQPGFIIHYHYLQEQMNFMKRDTIMDHFYYFVVFIFLCKVGQAS